ncbi:hypothetical protein TNCV_784641, partial [Trichonephila clavipes]
MKRELGNNISERLKQMHESRESTASRGYRCKRSERKIPEGALRGCNESWKQYKI